jgi:ribosomal protein S18 acetylase RimI-like enzyme
MTVSLQNNPDFSELENFFEKAFSVYDKRDEAGFSEVDDESQTLSEWFDMDAFRKYFNEGALIEAREDSKLVGALFLAKQHPISWPDGKKAEIFIIAVDPDFRGKKVGQLLMREAEKSARSWGAESIIVNTFWNLYSVQKFYQKNGFTLLGTLKKYYSNGDAVFLKKDLKS